MSRYLHDQNVPNMIFLDRSPRPLWVGIDEYWKENYNHKPRPSIYFVNPSGFDSLAKAKREVFMSLDSSLFNNLMFLVIVNQH